LHKLMDCRRDEACRAGLALRWLIAIAVAIAVIAGGWAEQAQASATTSPTAPGSQLQARAAVLPLAALMVCSRLCPAAGAAAAKVIRRAPKQIKPTRAPRPAIANAFTSAAGSSPGIALGNALAGSARVAARWRARGYNAHHIVAVRDPRAEFARMVLWIGACAALRSHTPFAAAFGPMPWSL
jgi:hypothetical protein